MNNLTLVDIAFPVFRMRQFDKLEYVDGSIYVHTHWKSYILDNKNLLGDTLGERRLRIKEGNIYPFKDVCNTPRDLVLQAKTGTVYVDNTGRVFEYKKTKKCPIVTFQIKSVVYTETKAILHFYKHPTPVVVPRPAYLSSMKYATIVKYGDYFLLYSLEEEYVEPFSKKL